MNLTSAATFYGYTRFYKLIEVKQTENIIPHLLHPLFPLIIHFLLCLPLHMDFLPVSLPSKETLSSQLTSVLCRCGKSI